MDTPTSEARPTALGWVARSARSVDSAEGRISIMAWDAAQAWCNFVLLKPDTLPAGLEIERATLRPEAPPGRPPGLDEAGRFGHGISNRASYQCRLGNRNGVQLEVKQFLYDLGPPAFDHPIFWLSTAAPFLVGHNIGWLGTNFRGRRGASVSIDRTMVEIDLIAGDVSREDLKTIIRALVPVSLPTRERILATPFAELCYQSRYPDLVITVPIGYWQHRRQPPSILTTMVPASSRQLWAGAHIVPPSRYGFRLDSVILFGDQQQPQELEWVYEHQVYSGHTLRVLVWPNGRSNPMRFPPSRDRQPCNVSRLRIGSTDVFHAYANARVGQHEAVWNTEELTAMLILKAAPWTDVDWFLGLLTEVVYPR